MFARNCWYAAATGPELGRELLPRTILGIPVVLFRRQDGPPVALQDRCAHRFLPLSQGRLIGDEVECGYHGVVYDCEGQCARIPGQRTIPRNLSVPSYPVVERWHFVWIWLGDPDRADPDLIPDLWRNDHPEWTMVMGDPIYVRGSYRYLVDNLMDPNHVQYVHRSTLGGDDVSSNPMDAWRNRAVSAHFERWILDKPPAPVFQTLAGFSGNVDRWQIGTYWPPAFVDTDMGSAPTGAGAPEGDRSQGIELHAYNLFTPETEKSSFYFWSHVRNFALGDPAVSAAVKENFVFTFNEDVAVIEGVQRNHDTFPDIEPVTIASDAAVIQARRVLNAFIDADQATAPALVPTRARDSRGA